MTTEPQEQVIQAERHALCELIENNAPKIDPHTGLPLGSEVEALADLILARHSRPHTPVEGERDALVEALRKVMPVRIAHGRDYAEVFFADGVTHSTQAMTMHPQDWLDLQAAWEAFNGTDRNVPS